MVPLTLVLLFGLVATATANSSASSSRFELDFNGNNLRRRRRTISDDKQAEPRQRVPIHPFSIKLSPITSLDGEEKKLIHHVLEDVATLYIRKNKFQDTMGSKFDEVLLVRKGDNVFGGTRYLKEDESSNIEFTGGAAAFVAPNKRLLPSSDTMEEWIKEAVEQELVPALQQTSKMEKEIDSVVYESETTQNENAQEGSTTANSSAEQESQTRGPINDSGSSSLGAGAVVGIVVGAVVVVGILAALFVVGYKRRREKQPDNESVASKHDKSSIGEAPEDDTHQHDNAYHDALDHDVASLEEEPQEEVMPSRKRLNLFADFFQPIVTLLYNSFNLWTRITGGPQRQNDMIAR